MKKPKPATAAPATRTVAKSAKPTAAKPVTGKPAPGKPTSGKPVTGKPPALAPAIPRPVARKPAKELTEGQRAYEAKRAAKAGLSLDKWLAAKERDRLAEEKARLKAAEAAKPAKPPGFFKRLLERAHKPLKTRI